MIKLALGVAYNGSNFHGWQCQKIGIRTVQSCIEKALSIIANHSVKVFCSGRTDSGVHAKNQVIHFQTDQRKPKKAWLMGANSYLPNDISLNWVCQVNSDFHARFNAIARSYQYHIYNHPVRSAINYTQQTWIAKKLDCHAMQIAANYLIGQHDFSAFKGSKCQAKSNVKIIKYLNIIQENNDILIIIKANSFLYHMVRNITGALVCIGLREKPSSWIIEVLDSRDRTQASVNMPPQGLCFLKAHYKQLLPID